MRKSLRVLFAALLLWSCVSVAAAQNPQQHWMQYQTPDEAGWSSDKLANAKQLYDHLDAAAFMAVHDGHVLFAWGDVYRRFMCHSVRKSLLSALYGTHVDDGSIDLDKTLGELNIDDVSPLTEAEKQAKIRDLLKARSGVYHPAAYETTAMKRLRPQRGSHPRDTFWYYNNWDFNALGTILEQEGGNDIFTDFKERIADRIQMEDFRLMDGYHHLEPENSIHPAYPFRLSARDMARFGLLFLRQGRWNGKQVISREWVEESTASYSDTGGRGGYGYLWWVSGDYTELGMYSAFGVGTQMIAVFPKSNLVLVQRVDTYVGNRQEPSNELIDLILAAKVADAKVQPKLIPFPDKPTHPEKVELSDELLRKYESEVMVNRRPAVIRRVAHGLRLQSDRFGTFNLTPLSDSKFFVEDYEQFLIVELDEMDDRFVKATLHQSEQTADFYERIVKDGIDGAIAFYRQAADSNQAPKFSENDLNMLGYQFLGSDRIAEAIEVFELNVAAYPEAFNVYDSLGEAYMLDGKELLARENYRKSLMLNPNNTNALEMLDKMSHK